MTCGLKSFWARRHGVANKVPKKPREGGSFRDVVKIDEEEVKPGST